VPEKFGALGSALAATAKYSRSVLKSWEEDRMKFAWLGVLATVAACSELPVAPPTPPIAPTTDRAESPGQAGASSALADDPLVSTPDGPRYRSCVHEVPNGARIDLDGVVTRPDGSKFQIPRCAHPVRPGRSQPTTHGWVESVRLYTGSYFHQVTANWTVPGRPEGSYGSSETFYTFPGMVNGIYVIQPVLQYGSSGAGGGEYWTMASWRCASGPDCYHSPLIGNVQSGHTMAGSVSASNCSGGYCDWTITTTDVTTGGTTTYTVRDTDNYSDGVGGAMEIWNLGSCNQLPPGVWYTNVSFLDNSGNPVTPGWNPSYDTSVVPQCGYQATGSGTNVSLTDNQVPTVTISGANGICQSGGDYHWSASYSGNPSGVEYHWLIMYNDMNDEIDFAPTTNPNLDIHIDPYFGNFVLKVSIVVDGSETSVFKQMDVGMTPC
jgi:hypothetical protein